MRVIKKPTLINFYSQKTTSDSKEELLSWYAEARSANWKTPHDILQDYQSASIIKGSRAVFDICDNKYRLVVKIHFNTGIVYIRFIGTHKEYGKINVEEI